MAFIKNTAIDISCATAGGLVGIISGWAFDKVMTIIPYSREILPYTLTKLNVLENMTINGSANEDLMQIGGAIIGVYLGARFRSRYFP